MRPARLAALLGLSVMLLAGAIGIAATDGDQVQAQQGEHVRFVPGLSANPAPQQPTATPTTVPPTATSPASATATPTTVPPTATSPAGATATPTAAACVNINTASHEDLQQIVHIGPERATEIISLRPFASVDGLDDVSGIGPARLQDIKDQGLACV